jgi:hypothetical protein
MKLLKNLCRINFLLLFVLNVSSSNAQTWTQIGKDIDGKSVGNKFGSSVSISGDGLTVAVGNDLETPSQRHVKVFKNINNNWTQLGNDIQCDSSAEGAYNKVSLSKDGRVIAVLNTRKKLGRVYTFLNIYKFSNGNWTQLGKECGNIDGSSYYSEFSQILSISGDGYSVALGNPSRTGVREDDTCIVRVYKFKNNDWTLVGKEIIGYKNYNRTSSSFGESISLNYDGSTVAIGANTRDDGLNGQYTHVGSVVIYTMKNETWTQVGDEIFGRTGRAGTRFGNSVSISNDGNIIAVGAHWANDNADDCGNVTVYKKNNNDSWVAIGLITGVRENDYLGTSVSLSGDGTIIAIGAIEDGGNGNNTGYVVVYENINGVWTLIGSKTVGEASDDLFGASVSINNDGSIVAIGAPMNSEINTNAGHVRVYTKQNTSSIQPKSNDILYKVYPNPTESSFYIQTESKYLGAGFSIFSMTGEELMKGNLDSEVTKLNLSDLSNGLYLLSIRNADIKQVFKIVKK